jgi:hypothetical protein
MLGDSAKLAFDLKHGIDANARTGSDSKSLLCTAIFYLNYNLGRDKYLDNTLGRYTECIECLLAHGADVNDRAEKNNPLILVLNINDPISLRLTELLLSFNANPNIRFKNFKYLEFNAISLAIENRSEEQLNLLLNNSQHPIELTQSMNNKPLLMLALEHGTGLAALLEKGKELLDVSWREKKKEALVYAETHHLDNAVTLLTAYIDPAENTVKHSK